MSTSASAAAPAAWSHPIVAAPDHCLWVIFGFLDLPDLASIASCCRRWVAIVSTGMPSTEAALTQPYSDPPADQDDQGNPIREEGVDSAPLPFLVAVCASPLARKHLSYLDMDRMSRLTHADRGLIADSLPMLRSFYAFFDTRAQLPEAMKLQTLVALPPWRFPAGLTSLDLRSNGLEEAHARALVSGLSQLRALTQLTLRLHSTFSIDPLVNLPLERLILDASLSMDTVSALRAMPSLTDLAIHGLQLPSFEDCVAALAADPAPRLLELGLRAASLTDGLAESLTKFTTLTALSPGRVKCSRMDWLPSLVNLRTVELKTASSRETGCGPDAFVAAFRASVQLTNLNLSHPDLASDHMARLLRFLPALRNFALDSCASLESLRCFAEAPQLSVSLESLCLSASVKYDSQELLHFTALRNLKSLSLFSVLRKPVDAALIASFQPPSVRMPALASFYCSNN